MQAASHNALWPLIAFVVAAFVITGGIIALTAVLGQRHRDRSTDELYESGIPAAGPLPRRLSLEFYLVAMFFVVFDIETVFILAWAIVARRLGWSGYLEVAVFVALLMAALLYLWRLGSLDWGTSGRMTGRDAWLEGRDAAASGDGTAAASGVAVPASAAASPASAPALPPEARP